MFWRRKRVVEVPQFMVFGLGNPGIQYMRSRHNIGWWVLDELARRHLVERTAHRHKGQADYCRVGSASSVLVKPMTFMNLSGNCVAAWCREFPEARFVVVYDDISLALGKLRLRREGSAGGHKGVQSIIDGLKSGQFDRIKVGVGGPGDSAASEYVLEQPTTAEEELIQPAVSAAADIVEKLAGGDYPGAQDIIAQLAQSQPADDSPDPGK